MFKKPVKTALAALSLTLLLSSCGGGSLPNYEYEIDMKPYKNAITVSGKELYFALCFVKSLIAFTNKLYALAIKLDGLVKRSLSAFKLSYYLFKSYDRRLKAIRFSCHFRSPFGYHPPRRKSFRLTF